MSPFQLLALVAFAAATASAAHALLAADRLAAVRRRWAPPRGPTPWERLLGKLESVRSRDAPELSIQLEVLGLRPGAFATLRIAASLAAASAALVAGLAALALPAALAAYLAAARFAGIAYRSSQGRLRAGLPDFLDLLRIHLAAGLNVPHALKALAPRVGEPLRSELVRLNALLELAGDPHRALGEFARRAGLPEVAGFVEAIRHTLDSGVVLEVFERQAAQIRELRRHEATRRTKLLPVLLQVVPGLLVVNILLLFLVPLAVQALGQFASLR